MENSNDLMKIILDALNCELITVSNVNESIMKKVFYSSLIETDKECTNQKNTMYKIYFSDEV